MKRNILGTPLIPIYEKLYKTIDAHCEEKCEYKDGCSMEDCLYRVGFMAAAEATRNYMGEYNVTYY